MISLPQAPNRVYHIESVFIDGLSPQSRYYSYAPFIHEEIWLRKVTEIPSGRTASQWLSQGYSQSQHDSKAQALSHYTMPPEVAPSRFYQVDQKYE